MSQQMLVSGQDQPDDQPEYQNYNFIIIPLNTPDQVSDQEGSDAKEQFMSRVHKRLGSHVLARDMEDTWLEDAPQIHMRMIQRMNRLFPCHRNN